MNLNSKGQQGADIIIIMILDSVSNFVETPKSN